MPGREHRKTLVIRAAATFVLSPLAVAELSLVPLQPEGQLSSKGQSNGTVRPPRLPSL